MPSKKSAKSDEVTTSKETVPVKETKTTKKTTTTKEDTTTLSVEKNTSTKSKTKPVVTEPVVTEPVPEPVAAAEVDNVVVTTECDTLTESFSSFMTKFQTVMTQFSALKTEFKILEKRATKQLKAAEKATSKRKRKLGNRAPSGFVKPARISDELANFLGKPIGSEMARTDVTSEINKYIVSNNLRDKDNGRKIIPDKALTTLLNIDSEVVLTYFNLQKYMSPHFQKMVKVDPNAPIAPTSTA